MYAVLLIRHLWQHHTATTVQFTVWPPTDVIFENIYIVYLYLYSISCYVLRCYGWYLWNTIDVSRLNCLMIKVNNWNFLFQNDIYIIFRILTVFYCEFHEDHTTAYIEGKIYCTYDSPFWKEVIRKGRKSINHFFQLKTYIMIKLNCSFWGERGGGLPINMSVMRYRKVDSDNPIVLKLLKVSREGEWIYGFKPHSWAPKGSERTFWIRPLASSNFPTVHHSRVQILKYSLFLLFNGHDLDSAVL